MEDNKNYQVFVSTPAAEQIKNQLSQRGTPDSYLRLGVKCGGCSGFKYIFQFEDSAPKAKDLVFDIEGVKIIIDNKSILYLNGITLDFEKSLIHKGFKFNNPLEKSSCGCGKSFSV
jgi:iron-sulfur cluster assembly protein